MIRFTDKGMYCEPGDFYIDPWRPVTRAVITHGHSDHARWGNQTYLCHTDTLPILKLRLGADTQVESMPYGERRNIGGVEISFHPAGHIIGSAQVRMAYKGEVWVVSGDYKLANDLLTTPFEPIKCHHFITESTFGLPLYRFDPPEHTYAAINRWWAANAAAGINTILLGYALGKAQALLHALDLSIGPVFLHGAVANVNEALAQAGYHFPGTRVTPDTDMKAFRGALIVAPPSAFGTPWMRKFMPYHAAMCSGWMALRGARRRKGVDKGFALSDHGDWNQLNQAVLATGATHIYVTHGYEAAFVRWLQEKHGLQAYQVKTLFHEGEDEDL